MLICKLLFKWRLLILYILGLPKTIYFNLRYFSLRDALRLPVFVSHRVLLRNCGGYVQISAPLRTRMVQIGFGYVGIFDARYSRSIWEVEGEVNFQGEVRLGHGTRISVGKAGKLVFAGGVEITAETAIICQKKISFGEGTLISWENLIMDTDFHHVIKNGEIVNHPAEINIGKQVWIGCRCTILKGSSIADNTIVAAGSLVTKKFTRENVVIGGMSAKILTDGVEWMA